MINPSQAIRQSMGLSVPEFAVVLGIGAHMVYVHEEGLPEKPAPKVRSGLAFLGFDPDKISTDYTQWRSALQEQLRRQAKSLHA